MKCHIFYYISLLTLFFGLVSCSSDEKNKDPASSFDFNLRVFAHDEGEQQLSSFGNSNIRLNDMVALYNGSELFPTWSLEQLKVYQLPGLSLVSTHVTCYDSENQKIIKRSTFSNSYFKVFEALPEIIFLENEPNVNCEFIVEGKHSSGASQTIVKMVSINLDATQEFRVYADLQTPSVYIDKEQLVHYLKDRNILKTDELQMLCKSKTDKQMQRFDLLSHQATQLQALQLEIDTLDDSASCRLLSIYKGNKFLSENLVLYTADVRGENTYFAPVNATATEFGSDHFYTFRFTNFSNKIYELYVHENIIETIVEFCAGVCQPFRVQEQISYSKPTFGKNQVQLLPFESVDVYIRVNQAYKIIGSPAELYDIYKHKNGMLDVKLNIGSGAFRLKAASESPHTTTLVVDPSKQLREKVDAMRSSHPFGGLPIRPPVNF
jgi:hypothetical protein